MASLAVKPQTERRKTCMFLPKNILIFLKIKSMVTGKPMQDLVLEHIYILLSISISSSFDILFHKETLDSISLKVPFATSGCLETVILCSPMFVFFRSRTWLPFCRIISYPSFFNSFISLSPLTTGNFGNRMHLTFRDD